MPESKKTPIYVHIIIIAIVLVMLGIAGEVYRRWTAPEEALPMKGNCLLVPVKKYVGAGDKDGKLCTWEGQKYWCMYDPNKNIWGCDLIEPQPVPAEKR